MSKALITGVNGFIGRHLYSHLLREGHEVLGIGRSPNPLVEGINYQQADVRNRQLMAEIIRNVDIVYHLAAQTKTQVSFEEPQLTFDINVGGTENVLYACAQNNAKLVFPSSATLYGSSKGTIVSEDSPLNPKGTYATSKLEAEKLCLDYIHRKELEVAIFRIFTAYGPLQTAMNGVIPLFFEGMLDGKSPEIYSDGNQERDFIFISDILDGLGLWQKAAFKKEPVNIGTGRGIKTNALVEMLLHYIDLDLNPVYVEIPHPTNSGSLADISRARALGFNPKVPFEEGLERYVRWAIQNRGMIQPKAFY